MTFARALTLLATLCLGACVSPRKPAPDINPRWSVNREAYDAAKPRDVRVEISIEDRAARLLDKAGTVLVEMDCSLGGEAHPTPVGKFRVTEKMLNKDSNLYGQYVNPVTGEVIVPRTWEHKGPRPPGTVYRGISMPYWMRLTSYGIGMHVGGFARGICTSHGCIRCPEEPQRLIYEKAPIGMPVRIMRK
jgi:lipoprotein-anchoring transpeptidase ErfK/SrfK